MAKQRMVTRTLHLNEVTCISIDENKNPQEVVVIVTGDFEGKLQEKILKEVKRFNPNVIYIKDITTKDIKMGMTEEDFYRLAHEITKEDTYFHPFEDRYAHPEPEPETETEEGGNN